MKVTRFKYTNHYRGDSFAFSISKRFNATQENFLTFTIKNGSNEDRITIVANRLETSYALKKAKKLLTPR